MSFQATRSLVCGLFMLALAIPSTVLANATVASVRGDVRAGNQTLTQGQRITGPNTITTGGDAQVVLNFDDGGRVVLHQNTEFRIVDFRYNQSKADENRAIFDIIKGALRVVTGVVAQRNQRGFQVRAPQATIGVRGTDFMVAIVNPLYVSVTHGAIAVNNAAGTVAFGAGSVGSVASASALGATIPATALPAAASGAFSSMSSVALSAVGAVPGVAGAGGAAPGAATGTAAGVSGGVGFGAAAGIAAGAVAGVAAAAGGGGDKTGTSHSATSHSK
jgi:hypothetical protein